MVMKMSEKRRWFSKMYSDSQENRTDTDISWSSSDSEQEHSEEPPIKKRMKIADLLQRKSPKAWINLDITPPKKHPVSPQHDAFFQSPTLGEIKLEDQSPILTQHDLSQSPVINRSKIVRRIKLRCRNKREKAKCEVIQDLTSDSSLSQTRLEIDSQSSPSKTQIVIPPAKSELSQPYNIDPFPSQHSSEVVSDSCPSNDSGQKQFLYNQPSRRKRLKKGSLGYQLQKAVHFQNTSTSIWEHEVFLSKSKGEELHQCDVSVGISFEFFVLNMWMEYGCQVLECKCDGTKIKEIGLKIENCATFILVTNSHNPPSVSFKAGNLYQIFPPYSTKVVNHERKQTLCIINAYRFVSV